MLSRARQFVRAKNGMAAVEFALIAPVMVLTFLGAVEVTSAIDCKSRVTHVAASSADLVAQSTAVSSTDVSNIFAAANAIFYPYASSGAKIVVSSLIDNGSGGVAVAWSEATTNTTKRSQGSIVPIPSDLVVKGSGDSVIMSEVTYNYVPPTAYFLTGGITLHQVFYSKPRRSQTVKHS